MAELYQLVEKYGTPDALIDHWDRSSRRFAVWGFAEIFTVNARGEAFLNGDFVHGEPMELWQKTLNNWKSTGDSLAAVGAISYDLKNILYPHIPFNKILEQEHLLWFGKPILIRNYEFAEDDNNSETSKLELMEDIPSPTQYHDAICKIKKYLKNGDSYQINFTQPKKFRINCSAFELYLAGRKTAQPHYGMYLDLGNKQILSFSPERFFKSANGIIESYPMKGTRPRSHDLVDDERLAGELYHSEKDRAEHLMIVDLIRNDLGKVTEFGSVKVEDLYSIQSFETVHQMVSKVYGRLKSSVKEVDIISALFPGGSITGAPKERSMEIIDELEGYSRGIYTGALGVIQSNGGMDFNIAIRTMIVNGSDGIYPVGGGIVWDSDSLEEWQEAQQKGKILAPFQKGTSAKKKNPINAFQHESSGGRNH